jgi:hypothetical protein
MPGRSLHIRRADEILRGPAVSMEHLSGEDEKVIAAVVTVLLHHAAPALINPDGELRMTMGQALRMVIRGDWRAGRTARVISALKVAGQCTTRKVGNATVFTFHPTPEVQELINNVQLGAGAEQTEDPAAIYRELALLVIRHNLPELRKMLTALEGITHSPAELLAKLDELAPPPPAE